jgi:hypothetical protein
MGDVTKGPVGNPTILTESKFVGTLHGVDNNKSQVTVSIRAGGGPTELIPMPVTLDGSQGLIHAGANGTAGVLQITDGKGIPNIRLTGNGASAWFGVSGQAGDILIFANNAKSYTNAADAAIWIKGGTGDIILQNADCAEEFEVCDGEGIEPGVVLALGDEGILALAHSPYDGKVAGVVSGAGGLRPGIVLGRSRDAGNRWPIALSGKVFCKVDADESPIRVGDLLTTSSTPGHAMAARDHQRAFGAVIGKALAPLNSGKALVPILVSLQ